VNIAQISEILRLTNEMTGGALYRLIHDLPVDETNTPRLQLV